MDEIRATYATNFAADIQAAIRAYNKHKKVEVESSEEERKDEEVKVKPAPPLPEGCGSKVDVYA